MNDLISAVSLAISIRAISWWVWYAGQARDARKAVELLKTLPQHCVCYQYRGTCCGCGQGVYPIR